ncbi:MAG: hypothetical protein ABEK03_07085 [Candidatus Bipolaricaulia bacterium]
MGGVTLIIGLLVIVAAPLSLAHGGEEVFSDEVGPYYVVANKSVEQSQGKPHLEYTVFLRDKEERRPVSADRASLQVSAETPGGSVGPIVAEEFSNQYYIFEPIDEGGTWTIDVNIQGELGEASFSHELQLPRQAWYSFVTEASPPALAGVGVAALTLIGGFVYWRVGRTRA